MKKTIFGLAAAVALLMPLYSQSAIEPGAKYVFGRSPGKSAEQVVIQAIESAQSSIEAVIYELTDKAIMQAFIDAKNRGRNVRIVADAKAAAEKYSLVNKLKAAGVSVRLDAAHAITHHKMMVIDHRSVEMGSFNWTAAAVNKNAEDDIWLIDVPGLAAQAEATWLECWNESK